jgi:hypothetical protein
MWQYGGGDSLGNEDRTEVPSENLSLIVFVTSRRACLLVVLQAACDYEAVAVYVNTAVSGVMSYPSLATVMISSYLPVLVCYILHGVAVVVAGAAVCASLTAKSSMAHYEGKSYVKMRIIKKTFLLHTSLRVFCS